MQFIIYFKYNYVNYYMTVLNKFKCENMSKFVITIYYKSYCFITTYLKICSMATIIYSDSKKCYVFLHLNLQLTIIKGVNKNLNNYRLLSFLIFHIFIGRICHIYISIFLLLEIYISEIDNSFY